MTLIRRFWRLFFSVATAAGAACGTTPTAPGSQPAELTALPRALTGAELKVRDGANAFSFALWGRLNAAQRDTNVFVSPLSASLALGMTMNGAANQTFDEMRSALQFGGAAQQEINEGYQSLLALLTSLDPSVQTRVANSIWYRNGFPFRQSFLDATRTYFDAEVRGLDFSDAAGSLRAINGWVDDKTNGKIPTILDDVRPQDVMFLINAIYFKGSWREKFDAGETASAPFHASGGATQTAQLMHRLGEAPYAQSPTWQAVDLPYGNGAFTMTVVLPKEGSDVETVAASLTPAAWQALTGALAKRKVDLSLPKLRLSYERPLNDDLRSLGMRVPFMKDVADFTQMSPMGNSLFIEFVKQKTFVDVNEEGTEAAAVTVVGIGVTSAPVVPVVRVDRPYIFVLRERLSGTVLFMGKIVRMPS
jgi:serine protease inhibitor